MQDKDTKDINHDVFISYATKKSYSPYSKDSKVAKKVCTALESQDIRCWIAPRDILPGEDWLDAIINAVEKSKIVVLVFSSNTNKSQWVKDEIKMSLEKKIPIIPFRINNVSPEGGLRILQVRCQWLDAYTKPMEKHIDHLVTVIGRHLREIPENVKVVQLKAKRVYKNGKGFWEADYGDGIVMVYIPPGEFSMGSKDEDDEKPPHNVYLDGYWMGKYPVTFVQYDEYFQKTKTLLSFFRKKPDDEGWRSGKRPVINVSWDDAIAYCNWLSGKIGLTFKLPTEAQWEKAARGTDQRIYPWGNQMPNEDLANFAWEIGKTSPVGSYPQGESPYGLLDMAGNVLEWCSDWYKERYYKKSPRENPQGPKRGSYRVIRGGGWDYYAAYIRCACRSNGSPSARFKNLGFRLCQDNR